MQGRITKVLNMKPPEILAMIEEAAGTMMYESKKQQAQKTIEKKDSKLREITDVIKYWYWNFPFHEELVDIRAKWLVSDIEWRDHAHFNQAQGGTKYVFGISKDPTRIGAFDQVVHRLQICHGWRDLDEIQRRSGSGQPGHGETQERDSRWKIKLS